MREIYELFKGSVNADAVLKAAGTRPQARFYAHLYIGLYSEAMGDATRAREQIALAAQPPFEDAGGYMHMVAVVHLAGLKSRVDLLRVFESSWLHFVLRGEWNVEERYDKE